MNRKRIKLEVYVDLDSVPGTFSTPESAERIVRNLLEAAISHYKPSVNLALEAGKVRLPNG